MAAKTAPDAESLWRAHINSTDSIYSQPLNQAASHPPPNKHAKGKMPHCLLDWLYSRIFFLFFLLGGCTDSSLYLGLCVFVNVGRMTKHPIPNLEKSKYLHKPKNKLVQTPDLHTSLVICRANILIQIGLATHTPLVYNDLQNRIAKPWFSCSLKLEACVTFAFKQVHWYIGTSFWIDMDIRISVCKGENHLPSKKPTGTPVFLHELLFWVCLLTGRRVQTQSIN